jgi:hypothetical protein
MTQYRTGIDAETGRVLTGYAHLVQSIHKIVGTMPTERVMRLDFGMEPSRRLGRNITVALAATLYRDAVAAIHRWEPEYRVVRLQLVDIDRAGVLAIYIEGEYYPEGRLGNYDLVEPANINIPLALAHRGAA